MAVWPASRLFRSRMQAALYYARKKRLARIAAEAGGGAPVAFLSLNFKSNTYSAAGVVITQGQAVGENTDWNNYDSATIVSGTGLIADRNANPTVDVAYSAMMLGGFVLVVTGLLGTGGNINSELLDLPDYNNETIFFIQDSAGSYAFGVRDFSLPGSNVFDEMLAPGAFKVAFRLTPSSIAMSVNGQALQSAVLSINSPNNFGISNYPSDPTTVLETMEFFALSDYADSDLVALST